MAACPACGADVPAAAPECPRCHLAAALFEAVQEAVGVAESDPRYATEVHELMRAVEGGEDAAPTPEAAAAARSGPAALAFPLRFPAPEVPKVRTPEGPSPPPLAGIPDLPALPSGGAMGLRRQIDAYQHLGRSMGLDLSDLTERDKEAIAVDDLPTLERVGREHFVRLAAALAEEYEAAVGRRNGLASLVAVSEEDRELEESRSMILAGDLSGGHERLERVKERLTGLEDDLATSLILVTEGDLLAESIRELGGDPGPALGPFDEGRRLLREGDRHAAEPVLARASVALWALLYPRMGPELRRMKDAVVARRAAGAEVDAELQHLRDLATHLKHRNFAAAITNFRALRAEVASYGPAPSVAPESPAAPPSAG